MDNLTSLRTASSCEEWGLVICFTGWSGRLKRLNEKTWGVAGIEQTMPRRSSNLSFGVCLVERPLREGPCWPREGMWEEGSPTWSPVTLWLACDPGATTNSWDTCGSLDVKWRSLEDAPHRMVRKPVDNSTGVVVNHENMGKFFFFSFLLSGIH